MAYRGAPSSEKPTLMLNGNSVELNHFTNDQSEPKAIDKLLTTKLGWAKSMLHPDNYQQLYTKDDQGQNDQGSLVDLTEGFHYTWDEAMAYEFAKFLNIGLDT